MYSLRVMLGLEIDERALASERFVENVNRLELFASMCGVSDGSAGQWAAHKLSLFLTFLQNLVTRENDVGKGTLAAKLAADGMAMFRPEKPGMQGLKDKLMKRHLKLKLRWRRRASNPHAPSPAVEATTRGCPPIRRRSLVCASRHPQLGHAGAAEDCGGAGRAAVADGVRAGDGDRLESHDRRAIAV